jgi:hypothetical protein
MVGIRGLAIGLGLLTDVGAKWAGGLVLVFGLCALAAQTARGETVKANPKHVIGATATIVEATSGLPFSARIDTGATTCSIHAIEWEIENRSRRPAQNIGKSIRILIKNEKGDEAWVNAVIAGRVRVRSSVQQEDDYHGRYKVLLPLEWNGVKKEVLVTLNDRTDMDYPLLIGRNFLRRDFLVDVDVDNADVDNADRVE